MKKGEIYEGVITEVLFPNRCLTTVENPQPASEDGQPTSVIVKNGIPGQRIQYRIIKKKHGRYEGQLLQVLQNSPLEKCDPGCSLFPSCGGCMYRTMEYEEQLAMKEQQIRQLLTPVLPDSFAQVFEGIRPSPVREAYRNKMEYSFGDSRKDGPLTLGLHRKGSTYDILTAEDCRIVHNDFNQIVKTVLDFCTRQGWRYYHKLSHLGYLRHLLIRRASATGEILVDLVTSSQYGDPVTFQPVPPFLQERDPVTGNLMKKITPNPYHAVRTEESMQEERRLLSELAEELRALPLEGQLIGVLHTVNDSVADVVQSDSTEILFGRDYFYEKLLGLEFKITPFSFFQTNSRGAELLYSKVREYLGNVEGQTVFDLYSGTGTIAQMMAPVCRKVVGVEIVEEAVEAARENAALNHLDNCEFLAGDVLKVLDTIEEKPDTIILDPPRDGVHPKALPKILAYGVSQIVYVSCKPTSLVRDLPVMIEHGYEVTRICCVDMFPDTVHVETVVLMSRVKGLGVPEAQ